MFKISLFKENIHMKLYKFYFYVNIFLLTIETVTIYLYNDNLIWLIIMVLSILCEVLTIISEKKNINDNKSEK